jgi:hypothetical protein
MEAFSMVFTYYYPQRWRDLLQYKLLIIRTYRQFSGRAWPAYDQAFREHAAAIQLTNWSQLNVQLEKKTGWIRLKNKVKRERENMMRNQVKAVQAKNNVLIHFLKPR